MAVSNSTAAVEDLVLIISRLRIILASIFVGTVIVGVLIVFIILLACTWYCCKRPSSHRRKYSIHKVDDDVPTAIPVPINTHHTAVTVPDGEPESEPMWHQRPPSSLRSSARSSPALERRRSNDPTDYRILPPRSPITRHHGRGKESPAAERRSGFLARRQDSIRSSINGSVPQVGDQQNGTLGSEPSPLDQVVIVEEPEAVVQNTPADVGSDLGKVAEVPEVTPYASVASTPVAVAERQPTYLAGVSHQPSADIFKFDYFTPGFSVVLKVEAKLPDIYLTVTAEKFAYSIRRDICQALQVSPQQLRDLHFYDGSIIIRFTLLNHPLQNWCREEVIRALDCMVLHDPRSHHNVFNVVRIMQVEELHTIDAMDEMEGGGEGLVEDEILQQADMEQQAYKQLVEGRVEAPVDENTRSSMQSAQAALKVQLNKMEKMLANEMDRTPSPGHEHQHQAPEVEVAVAVQEVHQEHAFPPDRPLISAQYPEEPAHSYHSESSPDFHTSPSPNAPRFPRFQSNSSASTASPPTRRYEPLVDKEARGDSVSSGFRTLNYERQSKYGSEEMLALTNRAISLDELSKYIGAPYIQLTDNEL